MFKFRKVNAKELTIFNNLGDGGGPAPTPPPPQPTPKPQPPNPPK